MKKFCWLAAAMFVATVVVISVNGRSAQARPLYCTEFMEKYAKAPGVDATFAETLTTTKCGVCHVGKNKKDRNSYGKALAKLLTPNEKDKMKVIMALDKVADEPSAADEPTFGELIKAGKLPGK